MLKAAKAYMATQVSTASQGDLLLMLYDTAISHLRQAIEKMRERDMATKGILITKAITIISELQESLNKERGGDISKNLLQLYFFCNTRLLQANLRLKPEMVEEVISILSGLRQAFAQIIPTQEGVASLAQPVLAMVPPVGGASLAPRPEQSMPAQPLSVDAVPEIASADQVQEAPPAVPADQATVNTARLRAANAYANSR